MGHSSIQYTYLFPVLSAFYIYIRTRSISSSGSRIASTSKEKRTTRRRRYPTTKRLLYSTGVRQYLVHYSGATTTAHSVSFTWHRFFTVSEFDWRWRRADSDGPYTRGSSCEITSGHNKQETETDVARLQMMQSRFGENGSDLSARRRRRRR